MSEIRRKYRVLFNPPIKDDFDVRTVVFPMHGGRASRTKVILSFKTTRDLAHRSTGNKLRCPCFRNCMIPRGFI
jgi:hypothetical protein